MKIIFATIVFFCISPLANAQWIVYDPPTYKRYDPVTARTTYYKGGRVWYTYNVPEITRRTTINTLDWCHFSLTYPFRARYQQRPILYLAPPTYPNPRLR
jgi:hypothetical protein